MITGLPRRGLLPAFAAGLLALLAFASYGWIVRVFKWLTLALFAYVAAALLSRPDWASVMRGTLLPRMEWSRDYLMTIVAILGSALSPYLYFWQSAQVVEHEAHDAAAADDREGKERRDPARLGRERRRPSPWRVTFRGRRLRLARLDVVAGMAVAMVITYSIVLTAGATLHGRGILSIATVEQAAAALEPVGGRAATLLFALGIIGTGALGVPVLAGSAAYAIAEAASWRRGLERGPDAAGPFYALIALEMVLGLSLDLLGASPVRMMFLAAVLNGLLAPPLLVILLAVANNRAVMGEHTNGRFLNILGGIVTVAAAAAAVAFLVSMV